MLRIRLEQERSLSEAAMDNFVCRMVIHVREKFGVLASKYTDLELEALVGEGVAVSNACDLVSEHDVCRLTDIMLALHWEIGVASSGEWVRDFFSGTYPPDSDPLELLERAVAMQLTELKIHRLAREAVNS